MKKVSFDQATSEFVKWLDFKKVKEQKRESLIDSQNVIVEAMTEGQAILRDEDKCFEYILTHPTEVDGKKSVEKLIFKPRITIGQVKPNLDRFKSTDGDGRMLAYAATVTGENINVIKGLDTEDVQFYQAFVSYFL